MPPSVSVGIVTYNQKPLCAGLVHNLLTHGPADLRVTIWDNKPDDPVEKYLHEWMVSKVTIVKDKDNSGYILPNNKMVRESTADYHIIANDDVTVGPGWWEACRAGFTNERVAVVGARPEFGSLNERFVGQITLPGAAPEYIDGWWMVWRRDLALKFGPFDQWHLTVANCEDADACLRVREAGYEINSVPDAPVWHLGQRTRKSLGQPYWGFHNHAYCARRWAYYLREPRGFHPDKKKPYPEEEVSPSCVPAKFTGEVVVQRTEAVGDVLLTTPIVRALRKQGNRVHVLTHHPEVFLGNPHVASVGLQVTAGKDAKFIDLNLAYENKPSKHILSAYAEAAGVTLEEYDDDWLELCPSDNELRNALNRTMFSGTTSVAIHPGPTAWAGRNWPRERFQAIANLLHDSHREVVVVGGEDAYPLQKCSDLRGLPLHETAAAIAACELFVGIDSLPFHLAQWAEIPAIALFGTIRAELRCLAWNLSYCLQGTAPCAGSHHRLPPPQTESQCSPECMNSITVDMVWHKIKEVLQIR